MVDMVEVAQVLRLKWLILKRVVSQQVHFATVDRLSDLGLLCCCSASIKSGCAAIIYA